MPRCVPPLWLVVVLGLLPAGCARVPVPDSETAMPSRHADPPALDTLLGEALHPNEVRATEAIAAAIEAQLRARYAPGHVRRDAHPKAHGCVRAELQVLDELPENLAQGLFVPGQRYRAWLRFSNGASDPARPDTAPDARGLAIKLLDVPGRKLLDAEGEPDSGSHDFVLINHPVFFANDPERYLALVKAAEGEGLLGRLALPLALGPRGALIAWQTTRHAVANPFHARYFSAVAYRLGEGPGRQAVKYSVRPCAGAARDPMPASPGPDFLREAMRRSLDAGEVCLELSVQARAWASMSVEDSMTEWDEADAPFQPVAKIRIPSQDFERPAQRTFCEDLSFTPWHALPAHRPLGVTNRIRRVVYERVSTLRHEMNSTSRREPE